MHLKYWLVVSVIWISISLSESSSKLFGSYTGKKLTINGNIYIIGSYLGRGQFSEAYLANPNNTNSGLDSLAIKISHESKEGMEEKRKNYNHWANSQESKVLKILGYFRDEGYIGDKYYIAQQYHSGHTLRNLIENGKILCIDEIEGLRKLAHEAIKTIHDRGIAHGDIHGNNIIFQEDKDSNNSNNSNNSAISTREPTKYRLILIDWGNSITKEDTKPIGFMWSKAHDYVSVDLMILKSKILFLEKYGIGLFWLNREHFCVKERLNK